MRLGERCDPVPDAVHASPNTNGTDWGTEVSYTCDPGYEWTDGTTSVNATCNFGTWSRTSIPACTSTYTHACSYYVLYV